MAPFARVIPDRPIRSALLTLLTLAALTAEIRAQSAPGSSSTLLERFTPVTDAMLLDPDPREWLHWRRTLDSWGYSPLAQIDRENVHTLAQVWGRPMEPGPNQATPLVHDGIMYLVNPGDVIQALDATNGDLLWEFRWELPEDLAEYTDWGIRKRNIAIFGNKIFHATAEGHLLALDARTGELAWSSKAFDYRQSIDHSSGPIVVRGKLISGEHCRPWSDLAGGCSVRAHDPETGRELWRRFVIARPGEPGGETWGGLPLEERRHASTWIPGSYDPELDLIYWGTAVPAPSPEVLRRTGDGELLYTNSTLALDPDTGEIVWYFQHLPRDNWDLDHPFERLLVNTVVAPSADEVRWINPSVRPGEERRVITGIPGKTGIVWTLDRATGEFLWARETIEQNVIADVDERTGHPTINEATIPRRMREPVLVCPSASGGKNWQAGAYSPLTNAMYMVLDNSCMDLELAVEQATLEDGYAMRTRMKTAESANGNLGTVIAISAETGETLWRHDQPISHKNPLLATGSHLLFGGDANRRFRAFDQRTGEVVWETILHGSATGFPITYEIEGRQYLAVIVGSPTESHNAIQVFALPRR